MPEGYLHLTCEQRCQIYALLQSGHSQAHIARQIGVDPSTISRELVRNTGARGYRFKQAHEKASQRREEASDKPRKMTPDLVELIEEKLTQEQWSPDQISGRLAKDGVAFISHERIYQHVWKDKKDGGTLYLHLRHSGKKYNRRKGKNSGRGLISNRVDIDQRPPIVAAKSRIGDWEADTIIGANHKGVVMSHVERTSKYTKLAKLPDKNADFVVQACARVLLPLADRIETITYDNGKEFASHAQIATSLGALSYFAKPYHSWERGLNEHTNGLFRQYFPKGSDLSILSDADVQRVEDKLNSRPRKILGYQTPREIFFSARNLPVALHFAFRPLFAGHRGEQAQIITFDSETATPRLEIADGAMPVQNEWRRVPTVAGRPDRVDSLARSGDEFRDLQGFMSVTIAVDQCSSVRNEPDALRERERTETQAKVVGDVWLVPRQKQHGHKGARWS